MSTKKNKNDVIYGDVDLSDDEFAPPHTKVRVTTMIDEDALGALKGIARKKGIKYQTLLNKIVRSYVCSPQKTYDPEKELNEESVRQIVRDELKKRRKV